MGTFTHLCFQFPLLVSPPLEKNGQMVLTDVTRLSRSSSSEDETSPPLGRMVRGRGGLLHGRGLINSSLIVSYQIRMVEQYIYTCRN